MQNVYGRTNAVAVEEPARSCVDHLSDVNGQDNVPTSQVLNTEEVSHDSEPAATIGQRLIFFLPVLGLSLIYVFSGIAIREAMGVDDWTGKLRIVWMLQYALVVIIRSAPELLSALAVIILALGSVKFISDRRGGRLGPYTMTDFEPPPLPKAAAGFSRVAGVVLFISILSMGFTQWKVTIPYVKPLTLDPVLMRLDYTMHFNVHPWQLVHAVFGPSFATFLDLLYHPMWMWATWCIVPGMVAALSSSRFLRQYLLAFMLVLMLLGTALAIAFASGGPIYYEAITGEPGPFRALIEFLETSNDSASLTAWALRDYLWQAYTTGTHSVGTGISAMPSIHVATATLTTIVAFRWNRMAGAVATVYLVLIVVGSVYLAWHYAVDAYVSILCTPLLWWGAGRVLNSYDRIITARPRRLARQISATASS